jgi:probable HAF family extracellular repeat protein
MRINDIGCKARLLAIAATISIGMCFVSPASAQEYHLFLLDLKSRGAIDLGSLGNEDYSAKAGINDAGQVFASFRASDNTPHAFITGPNGKDRIDLGTLGGKGSEALDVNASGQVVGWSNTPTGDVHAFITRPNGVGMTDLGTLGGKESRAYGINDSGQVVGSSTTAEGVHDHAFITGSYGVGMKDLGTLDGVESAAFDINASGQVVGSYSVSGGADAQEYPYYSDSFITGPNGVGITAHGGPFFDREATGINDAGQVIGFHIDNPNTEQYLGFVTGPNGVGSADIPFGFLASGQVSDINSAGQVVGWVQGDANSSTPFITDITLCLADGGFGSDRFYIEPPQGCLSSAVFRMILRAASGLFLRSIPKAVASKEDGLKVLAQ